MANAFDYPVYFPYGATTSPYSPSNPHKGDDRCNKMNVPVVVNGVQIGLTGATGYTFDNEGNQGTPGAAHLHTQKLVNGAAVNPRGGGKTLKAPVTVTAVSQNSGKGKYVQLKDGDGALWEYLHLSRQDVKQGQTLQGGDMPITKEQEQACSVMATGWLPGKDYNYKYVGTTDVDGMLTFWQTQITRISKEMEKQEADGSTGIPNVIGDGYNSPYVGQYVVSTYPEMAKFWNKQPKAGSGNYEPVTEQLYKKK